MQNPGTGKRQFARTNGFQLVLSVRRASKPGIKPHFGLKNAGHTYVKALQKVLEPVKRFTASYIDEVAVYTNSWATHMKVLDKFLQVIRQSGITFNFKKCQFALPEIKFVGHIIGSGRHCLDPSKASVVHDMKRPITKIYEKVGFLAHF